MINAMEKIKSLTIERLFPYLLILGGVVGLFASFMITYDKFKLLENPSYQPVCSLNPVISCGSVMNSKQGAVFGFPNPFIGLAAFAVLLTVGVSILAGAKFKRWFWLGLELGSIGGLVFVHWLFYQSVFRIQALCIFCMMVWAVVIPIFLYSTIMNLRQSHLRPKSWLKKLTDFIERHHLDILIVWYLAIFVAIIQHFWYYWKLQLP